MGQKVKSPPPMMGCLGIWLLEGKSTLDEGTINSFRWQPMRFLNEGLK